jgi:hypothetical protein
MQTDVRPGTIVAMAPLPVIADVNRVSFEWFNAGQNGAANVMHFSAPGKTPLQIYTLLASTVAPHMWEAVSADGRISEVRITPLDGTSPTQTFVTPVSTEWEGQSSGAIVPAVACVVKLATAIRGRSYRGRLFLPWLGEGSINAGFVDTTPLALMVSAWGSFANAMETGGVALGVASYKLATWHQAINVGVEHACATQRRRQSRLR